MNLTFVVLFAASFLCTFAHAEDFYEMLGITKNADQREIRKAFKKKALELHPDKNTDDPEAHNKFVRMNRAYEVLKDEELRKKYDMYGEEGLESDRSGHQYHSWNYYHDNFGIYDDDPEIITLNKADFEQSVTGSEDIWFINFYHPMCSHCHTLAPVWREVARELEGVVRIGAVNCDDDYHLCNAQGIGSYPSLISYPERTYFRQEKTKENLINYMLQKVQSKTFKLSSGSWKTVISREDTSKKPWLVNFYEYADEEEDFWITQTKLSAIFDGLVNIGHVICSKDHKLCSKFDMKSGLKFFDVDKIESGDGKLISSLDAQEIAREILALLPEMTLLDESSYKNIRQKLDSREENVSWLVQFSSGNDDDTLEIRKLPALLPSLNLGRIDCSTMKVQCDDLYIAKTPTFILFKPGGGYELHHGRLLAHDIAVFAREGASSTKFQILTPQEFPKVLQDGSTWFVDFYAPWCPPCMKLLPEFRKASRLVATPVNFGSIDCTMHQDLCTKFNIRQYPTTILYNQSVPHEYTGHHSATHLVEFVNDTLNPVVVSLDPDKFSKFVASKPQGEVWVVDYFANWCGPCLSMAPEYRRFARLVADIPEVHVASLDCAVYGDVCRRQGINSYPSVVLYPSESYGTRRTVKFSGWSRDADSFRQWLYSNLPSRVTELDDSSFEEALRSNVPWIIDFYAPWCGHCQVFAPNFEDIARELKGTAKFGKLNCERYVHTCRGANVRAYPTVRLYTGSLDGSRQNVNGITFPKLQKEDIIARVPGYLPLRKISKHDEL
ncbi:dnaJ homolog subfamily C member 10-like [Macrobrachium rosenbergii]|uniref:dnaJ homolog subfamily C member 10-like n=1 Tax=Macrobrachium rosenbergii TaxID=79674 RepID=UPI0034D4072C